MGNKFKRTLKSRISPSFKINIAFIIKIGGLVDWGIGDNCLMIFAFESFTINQSTYTSIYEISKKCGSNGFIHLTFIECYYVLSPEDSTVNKTNTKILFSWSVHSLYWGQ